MEKVRLLNILDRLITHVYYGDKFTAIEGALYEKNRCRWCCDPKRKE